MPTIGALTTCSFDFGAGGAGAGAAAAAAEEGLTSLLVSPCGYGESVCTDDQDADPLHEVDDAVVHVALGSEAEAAQPEADLVADRAPGVEG